MLCAQKGTAQSIFNQNEKEIAENVRTNPLEILSYHMPHIGSPSGLCNSKRKKVTKFGGATSTWLLN